MEDSLMAEIAAGIACSHVPFLAMHPEFERAGAEQRNRVVAGFDAARPGLRAGAGVGYRHGCDGLGGGLSAAFA
jgi:hypothetical protein